MPQIQHNYTHSTFFSRLLFLLVIFLCLMLIPLTTHSFEQQSHESIKDAVKSFIFKKVDQKFRNDITVTIGTLDKRLRLSNCLTPLDVQAPTTSLFVGNISVRVKCHDEKTWTIFIPTTVSVFDEVVINTRPLTRGDAIQPTDLIKERRDISKLMTGYYTHVQEAAGQVATRSIRIGSVITPKLVKPQNLVKRGENVIIKAISAGLEIQTKGEALSDGAKGDLIRIRNTRSNQVVEGIVTSQGIVEIRM